MGRGLVVLGIAILVTGLLWPWLGKLGLGHLPGDIRIERKGMVFHFPLTSTVLVSAALTLALWLFRR